MQSEIRYLFPSVVTAMLCSLTTAMPSALAQTSVDLGWVEGVLVTEHGGPATSFCMGETANEAYIVLQDGEGRRHETKIDLSLGGYYSFRDLKPGVYEIFVKKTEQCSGNEKTTYRPQHIFGVIVEPAKRTKMDITVHGGSELEEIGQPLVVNEDAIIISEYLRQLGESLSELQYTVKELQDSLTGAAP